MARTVLPLQNSSRTGLQATYTAATVDGHAFDNASRKVLLHVKNASASPVTVTIDVPKTADGNLITDLAVTIPASEDRFIGPFGVLYEQVNTPLAIDQAVHINTSVQTSITYAAIKLAAS